MCPKLFFLLRPKRVFSRFFCPCVPEAKQKICTEFFIRVCFIMIFLQRRTVARFRKVQFPLSSLSSSSSSLNHCLNIYRTSFLFHLNTFLLCIFEILSAFVQKFQLFSSFFFKCQNKMICRENGLLLNLQMRKVACKI